MAGCDFFPCRRALLAALALCAASAFAAMPDAEFASLCFSGTAAQVQQALADGANPNARSQNDPQSADPALHLAARSYTAAADKVRALLAAGADVNARERRYGRTALMDAAVSDSIEVVAALLAADADVNARDEHFGQTALFDAARNGHAQMIAALLRAGAAVDALGKIGQTPLMAAASSGKVETVRALLAAGADTNLKDGNGWNALQHARFPDEDADREGAAACVKLLQGEAKKPAASATRYVGSIGPYPVTLFLDLRAEGEWVGRYFYNKRPQSVFRLKAVKNEGLPDGFHEVVLHEYTTRGNQTGTFKGRVVTRGEGFSGTFVNSKGQSFPFDLHEAQ